MARLPLIDPDDPTTDPLAATLLLRARRQTKDRGLPWESELNVSATLANHPELFEAFNQIGRLAYSANGLTPVQRELCWLACSFENRCHY